MTEFTEQFKEMLKWEDDPEGTTGRKNAFFASILNDRDASLRLLLFLIDALERLALLDRDSVETRTAKQLMAFMPTTTKFFGAKKFKRGRDVEGMEAEIYALNNEYLNLRKLLVHMLEHFGPLALSKALWNSIDERDLVMDYKPELDVLQIGTGAQSRHWKTLGEVVEEEAARMPEEEREKLEEEERARVKFSEEATPTLVEVEGEYQVRATVNVAGIHGLVFIQGVGTTIEEALSSFNAKWTAWPRDGGAGRMYPVEMEELRKEE